MKKVLICIMVIAVMATSLVLFAGCQSSADIESVVAVDELGNSLKEGIVYDMPKSIVFLADNFDGLSSASPGGLTAKVTVSIMATVLPETANNKKVDWYVAWDNPDSVFATGKDVKEYINVIPSADGSTTATVEAYQAFESEVIIITVITRAGGFSATCNVTYDGIPIDFSFSTDLEMDSDGFYLLTPNTNNVISLDLTNAFGSVGSSFYDFNSYIGKSVTGSFAMAEAWHGITKNYTIAGNYFLPVVFPENAVTISGTSLIINPVDIYSADYSDRVFSFDDDLYNSPEKPYFVGYGGINNGFEISVKNNYLNQFIHIKVRVLCQVTGASMSSSSLVF